MKRIASSDLHGRISKNIYFRGLLRQPLFCIMDTDKRNRPKGTDMKLLKSTGYRFYWTGEECGQDVEYLSDLLKLRDEALERGDGFIMYMYVDGGKVVMD